MFEKLGMKQEQILDGTAVFYIKDYKKTAEELGIGEITLRDIIKELQKPDVIPVMRCRNQFYVLTFWR